MTPDIAAALRRVNASLADTSGLLVVLNSDLRAVLAELDRVRADLEEAIVLLGAARVGQLTISQRQRHGVLLARHPEVP